MTGRKFWVNDREAVMGITLVLLFIGTINIFSSSFVVADMNYGSPYFFLKKQGLNILAGFFAFLVAWRVNYHVWAKIRMPILLMTFAMLAAVFFFGIIVNGARRWLQIGSVTMQPAEFAKLTAIILEAEYLSWRVGRGFRCTIFQKAFWIIAALALIIEIEPDMGTAIIVLGVPVLMIWLSNMKASHKGYMVLAGVVLIAVMCAAQPYRIDRIRTMFDPWADPRGKGYQIVQSLQAIGSGGVTGMGLGVGISKYHYLPEAYTDFAFAVWCQETGFVGALFVILLFAALVYYGARIAISATDIMGQAMATGMTSLFFLQTVINLLMVSGWMPVVGVPLPFISYGGTSLIVSMFAVGVLVNIGAKSEKRREVMTSAPPPDVDVFGRPRLRRIK